VNLSNDQQLMTRVTQGDEQAFLSVYDLYSGRVYALAVHMLHDNMLAEEITQDTFLKLWSRARQYLVERGPLVFWLLSITRNAVLDRLRMENRRPQLSDSVDPEDKWDFIPDHATLSEESRWRSLHFAVQALPQDQRKVIELAYFQGLSQSEIAEELGWPLGTVKTRLRSGVEALRSVWLQK
jgi:RNA polymerase sigma-70 factor (ECF subfamily)